MQLGSIVAQGVGSAVSSEYMECIRVQRLEFYVLEHGQPVLYHPYLGTTCPRLHSPRLIEREKLS